MYLVADYHNTFLRTDASNLLQVFLLPADSGRVVRVAENHHLAALDIATKCLEVHRERGFRATKRALHDHALTCFRHKAERMIDGFLYEDAVALLREGLHSKEDARHDARDVANHLTRDVHTVLLLVPSDDAFVVRRVLTSVAKDALLEALPYCVKDERRRSEVHIGHPHRDEVIGSTLSFHAVNLNRVCPFARDNLVEVVFHNRLISPCKCLSRRCHNKLWPRHHRYSRTDRVRCLEWEHRNGCDSLRHRG